MRIFADTDGNRPAQGGDKFRQALCLSVLLMTCLYTGASSSAAAAQAIQPTSLAQNAAASVIADERDNGLSRTVRARAGLKNRIFLKYREMAVISDDQYRITQAAIRDNRAHQTPLRTSELLFNKCMHDGRYSEAAITASLAVLDSSTPVDRARFTLLQAEACAFCARMTFMPSCRSCSRPVMNSLLRACMMRIGSGHRRCSMRCRLTCCQIEQLDNSIEVVICLYVLHMAAFTFCREDISIKEAYVFEDFCRCRCLSGRASD